MEKLELKNRKGQKLVGILERPSESVRGTCIVQHGYGGMKEQPHIQKMKQAFLDNGFTTFNFDTTNSFGESDGDYEEARLGLHSEDLEDVVKWIKEQEWFQRPLALTGHSMGGYAVAKYTEDHPEDVDILAPIAPVVSGELSFEANKEENPEGFEEFKRKGYKESVSQTTGLTKKSPWAQMEERLDHDLLPRARNITIPTLLVVGSEDTSCRPQDIKKLFQALPENGHNKYVEIEGAPHTYRTEKDIDSLYKIITDWLKSL